MQIKMELLKCYATLAHFPSFAPFPAGELRSRLSNLCARVSHQQRPQPSLSPDYHKLQRCMRAYSVPSTTYLALEIIPSYYLGIALYARLAEHWLQACQIQSVQSTSLPSCGTSTSHTSKQGMWASWRMGKGTTVPFIVRISATLFHFVLRQPVQHGEISTADIAPVSSWLMVECTRSLWHGIKAHRRPRGSITATSPSIPSGVNDGPDDQAGTRLYGNMFAGSHGFALA